MPTPEKTRTRKQSPRFYRQYIDENDSLSAAPNPASSLAPTHLRAPSPPSTRNGTNDATARAQPRRSLDIASKALGIRSLNSTTTDAVTQPTNPLLDTHPNLTLHLPNGRVLPPLSPTASKYNTRSRSSSLGQTGSQHVSQATGINHNRSASHTVFSPATSIAILHPLRPSYRNASSDPPPLMNPLSSPVITIREPSPPPSSESRSPFQSQSRSRNNSIDIGKTGTGRIRQLPEETPAPSRRRETRDSSPDALASGAPSPQWPDSRSPLEFRPRSRDHSFDITAEHRIQQTDANAPSPCLKPKEPTAGDSNPEAAFPSPPTQRFSFDSRSGRQSRSHSMELARTNHVKRPYHRASMQSLQMSKPTLISVTAKKESLPEANDESAPSSLSAESQQTSVDKPFPHIASITVARLTPLNSHPPSPIIEEGHTRGQGLVTNDGSDSPAFPPRPKHASPPLPSIRSSFPTPSPTDASAALVTDSEPSSPHDTETLSFPPVPKAPANIVLLTGAAISAPTIRPSIPPAASAPMMPGYPPPPPPRPQLEPRSETIFIPRMSSLPVLTQPASALPTPSPPITNQLLPPQPEVRQPPAHPSSGNFTTQGLTRLRAATASKAFHIQTPSTVFSSLSSKSSSSSSSTTSTSAVSIPTPQSPPVPNPSLTYTSDVPLTTLTQHVQIQLSQARHLFTSLSHHLNPAENTWIHDTISDTETAVREILILTESLRVDREVNNGKIGLKTQLKWAIRDSRKAKSKRARLVLCHASLGAVLVRLQGVQTEYAGNGTGYASANAETGKPDGRQMVTSANARDRGPTTSGPDNLPWKVAVQLQNSGMELVADEPTGAEARSAMPQSPTSTISGRESIEPAQGNLDNELLDMLSWRWAQGRTKTTTTQ
ncbi:hypothetical protein BDW75DRAFT_202944 [Aspergillus navahoensis]